MSPIPSPLDPDLGDAMAQQLRRDRLAGNLASTHQALAASREGAWDRRWFYLSRIDAQVPRPALDAYCQQAPQDPLAYLMRGAQGIAAAWAMKDSAPASAPAGGTGQEAWQRFLEGLGAAEQDLRYAAQLDPADPTPYALLLAVDKGKGAPREAMEQDFAALKEREPEHLPGHLRKLEYLSAQWQGSHDLMFAFAREVSAGAQNGSDLHTLLVAAHLEYRDALFREQNPHGGRSHLKVPATQTELNTAYARSYGTPMHQGRWWSYLGHNKFAYYFQLLPDPFRLKTELAAIGAAFDLGTWGANAAAAGNAIREARNLAEGRKQNFIGGSPASGAGGSFKRGSFFERMGILNTIRLGCAGVGIVIALIAGAVALVNKLVSDHENVVYFVNTGPSAIRVTVDGQTDDVAPWGYLERSFEPGSTHPVALYNPMGNPAAQANGQSEEGTFTVPERAHMWSDGVRAIYDLSGQGRYVSATVPYGTSARPSTVPIGVGQRFFLFPEGVREYVEHFPNQVSGDSVTKRGICYVDLSAGDVPCLR